LCLLASHTNAHNDWQKNDLKDNCFDDVGNLTSVCKLLKILLANHRFVKWIGFFLVLF
jgi:hypothetical protein